MTEETNLSLNIHRQLDEYRVPNKTEKGDMDLSERIEWIVLVLRKAQNEQAHWKRIAERCQEKLSALLTRPEPSRLEIAAMIYAAWEANPEIELVRQTGSDRAACFEPCGAVLEADALIAAVEGRCDHDSH
jgi:hypothetical protein